METVSVMINGRAAAREQVGGVERWARELVWRLPALDPARYSVAAPPRKFAHLAGHVWEQAVLPARARRLGARTILSPANTAPLAWPRNAVVIHDGAVFRHPEWFSRPYAAWQRRLLPAVIRRASIVITVSEFSRRELTELLELDPAAVAVVHGGVSEAFHPEAETDEPRRAHGLERPYVLAVGTPSVRKNLGVLGQAARALDRLGVDLVVAGAGRAYLRVEETGLRMLGYVPEARLPGLYAGARAVVIPSRYEGFGLPCLEAMASGTPVVAAHAAGLPEACGDAALLVDPDDEHGFAGALERVVADEHLRSDLVRAGLARASLVTWDVTAKGLDALLRSH